MAGLAAGVRVAEPAASELPPGPPGRAAEARQVVELAGWVLPPGPGALVAEVAEARVALRANTLSQQSQGLYSTPR